MNRRGFLALAGAMVLDPERLLWRPGTKLISIPKPAKLVYVHITEIAEWSDELTSVTLAYLKAHPLPRPLVSVSIEGA